MPTTTRCEMCGHPTANLFALCDSCQKKADEEAKRYQEKMNKLTKKPIRPSDVFPVYKKG